MNYRNSAIEALKTSEAKLRDIITEALQAHSYGDVARVAHAVEAVATLIAELGGNNAHSGSPGNGPVAVLTDGTTVPEPKSIGRTPALALRKNQYPLFVKDGDRLVKIAWSKKERKPYEHRAPKAVVSALINAVLNGKGEGKLFEALDILPLDSESGEEYPSYQSYLALAWLRHIGVVIKKGREGYIIKRGATSAEQLEKYWEELPILA